jgi:hypothetical protein
MAQDDGAEGAGAGGVCPLRCNKCWAALANTADDAVVTKCSHVFCALV